VLLLRHELPAKCCAYITAEFRENFRFGKDGISPAKANVM
jgi:hypothetical protein